MALPKVTLAVVTELGLDASLLVKFSLSNLG